MEPESIAVFQFGSHLSWDTKAPIPSSTNLGSYILRVILANQKS